MIAPIHTVRSEVEEYKGWTIVFRGARKPFKYTFYEPSICFGQYGAEKPHGSGMYCFVQPIWLSLREYRKVRTPLDKESAIEKMLYEGKLMIKTSINKHEKGWITANLVEVPTLLDPSRPGDLDKARFKV